MFNARLLKEGRIGEAMEWAPTRQVKFPACPDPLSLWQMQKEFTGASSESCGYEERPQETAEAVGGVSAQCSWVGTSLALSSGWNSAPQIKILNRKRKCHNQWPQRLTQGQGAAEPSSCFPVACLSTSTSEEIHSSCSLVWWRDPL